MSWPASIRPMGGRLIAIDNHSDLHRLFVEQSPHDPEGLEPRANLSSYRCR